jgi:hypothetical protein
MLRLLVGGKVGVLSGGLPILKNSTEQPGRHADGGRAGARARVWEARLRLMRKEIFAYFLESVRFICICRSGKGFFLNFMGF